MEIMSSDLGSELVVDFSTHIENEFVVGLIDKEKPQVRKTVMVFLSKNAPSNQPKKNLLLLKPHELTQDEIAKILITQKQQLENLAKRAKDVPGMINFPNSTGQLLTKSNSRLNYD